MHKLNCQRYTDHRPRKLLSILLCKRNEIEDPGSRGFEIKHGRKHISLFVVHRDGVYSAFINSCPHTGVNLEWQEDRFLDLDNTYIQCATHDALFETDSGLCIAGPCVGQSLQAVAIEIIDDEIHFDPVSLMQA
jgi:nitrite reductase/ring-hydroxylating ferredoxin subunit